TLAKNLLYVQINNRSIVEQDFHKHPSNAGRIRDSELLSKIVGDVFISFVGAIADDSRFVALAIAQYPSAGGPSRIIESRRHPACTLVAAVIEIFPARRLFADDRRVEIRRDREGEQIRRDEI